LKFIENIEPAGDGHVNENIEPPDLMVKVWNPK